MSAEFWRVYGYLAKNWYEQEYSVMPDAGRWYHPAMRLLEHIAAQNGLVVEYRNLEGA